MAIQVAITAVGMAIALVAIHGPAILLTLCLSLSAANLVSAAYLHWRQVLALPAASDSRSRQLLGNVAASAVSIVPGIVVAGWLEGTVGSGYPQLGVAIAAIAASGFFCLGIQWIRGSGELRSLLFRILSPTSSGGLNGIARTGNSTERSGAAVEPPR